MAIFWFLPETAHGAKLDIIPATNWVNPNMTSQRQCLIWPSVKGKGVAGDNVTDRALSNQ